MSPGWWPISGRRPGSVACWPHSTAKFAVDLFDQPETLTSAWQCLVGSYARDARAPGTARLPAARELHGWLERLIGANAYATAGVGLGEAVTAENSYGTFSAFVCDRSVVHLAAFAVAREATS